MRLITFEVHGTPAPQGSKTRVGKGVREDNPATAPWRNAVAAAAAGVMSGGPVVVPMLVGPLFVEATFRFGRPASHYRTGKHAGELKPSAPLWCSTRPDLDKLMRALGDAITGIVCADDARIVELELVKVYGEPGCIVTIGELGGAA